MRGETLKNIIGDNNGSMGDGVLPVELQEF
jgi:hypothetical protein